MDMQSGGAGFITGAITFCGLKPMRAIPAKLVCIAGLNNGEFPRRDRPASFDLIAAERRPGDRSPRDDDRYAFLEAVLSARERLILTYVGRSQKDNSELAPSSVLSEVIGVIDATFQPVGDRPRRIRCSRRSMRCSRSARDTSRRVPTRPRRCAASRRRTGGPPRRSSLPRMRPQLFVRSPLPSAKALPRYPSQSSSSFGVIPASTSAVASFACGFPATMAIPTTSSVSAPIPSPTTAFATVWSRAGSTAIPGDDREFEALRADFGLPHAGIGRAHYAELDREARDVRREGAARRRRRAGFPSPIDGGRRGRRLAPRRPYRAASRTAASSTSVPPSIKAKDYLRAWIPHVALNVLASAPARETKLIGEDKRRRLRAVERRPGRSRHARARLSRGPCVAAHRCSSEPPSRTRDRVATPKKDRDRSPRVRRSRRRVAFSRVVPPQKLRGDADDEHFQIVFRDREPLGDDLDGLRGAPHDSGTRCSRSDRSDLSATEPLVTARRRRPSICRPPRSRKASLSSKRAPAPARPTR